LTWKDHIAKVTKKIVRASGIIAKMRHFVNRNSLKLIYYRVRINASQIANCEEILNIAKNCEAIFVKVAKLN
jgi:hypothetical protein